MCFPLLKSSLMVWKAYILFPNEAQCPTSSKQVVWYALSCVTLAGLVLNPAPSLSRLRSAVMTHCPTGWSLGMSEALKTKHDNIN